MTTPPVRARTRALSRSSSTLATACERSSAMTRTTRPRATVRKGPATAAANRPFVTPLQLRVYVCPCAVNISR